MTYVLAIVLFLVSSPVRADPFATAMQHVRDGHHAAAAAGFHALAQSGDATAAHNLAILFALGQGVPQNRNEAAFWALSALLAGLDQGAPLADLMLAELSLDERGALSARLEARLGADAAQGDGAAMLALAVVLALVRPEPDLKGAYAWQSIAAALDVSGAVRAREVTLAMLPPALHAKAQAQAWAAFGDWCAAQEQPGPASCTVIETASDSAGPVQIR